MGDPYIRREAVRAVEYMIPECRSDLNCIVHDADIPLPDYLKDIEYDLIVLGSTFLGARHDPYKLNGALSSFEFIKHSAACKVALPQDDYDCSQLLDDWMMEWGVHWIYSVCPEYWDLLYPRSNSLDRVRLGYTGYISEEWIDTWANPKDAISRGTDVCYRASNLPANFGSVGQLKGEIASRFINAASPISRIKMDISINPKDMIPGQAWHSFLENSKFCITTPSGSSLQDPKGDIRRCVDSFLARNPNAAFQQIADSCFFEQDNKLIFTALSPRNIEAALSETVQLATPGSYSGLMLPMAHFIPLAEDCSNIVEVLEMMRDDALIATIRKQCKESMLSEPRLRRDNIVNEIIGLAEDFISTRRRGVAVNQTDVSRTFDRYRAESKKIESIYWGKKRILQKLTPVAVKTGVRRLRNKIVALKRN